MPFTKATPAVAPYKALGSELITSLPKLRNWGSWCLDGFLVGFLLGFLFPIFFQSREKKRACLRSSTWNKGEENSEKARFSTFGIPTMNLGDRPWIWGIDQGRISSPIPKQLFKNKGTRFRLLFSGNVLTSFLYNPHKLQPRISSPTSFLAAPELLGWNHFLDSKNPAQCFFNLRQQIEPEITDITSKRKLNL